MTNDARFVINGTPSEDPITGDRGYVGTPGATLDVALEANPSAALSVLYEVYEAGYDAGPFASKNAPLLTWIGSGTARITPPAPTNTVQITLPASGVHSWIIRATASVAASDAVEIWEREVVLRTSGTSPLLRKTVPAETSQYESRGFSDTLNDMVDAIAGFSAGAVTSVNGLTGAVLIGLDECYDKGASGTGRVITADAGTVEISVPDAANNRGLEIYGRDVTNNPGCLFIEDFTSGIAAHIAHIAGIGLQIERNAPGPTSPALRIDDDATAAYSIELAGAGLRTIASVNGNMSAGIVATSTTGTLQDALFGVESLGATTDAVRASLGARQTVGTGAADAIVAARILQVASLANATVTILATNAGSGTADIVIDGEDTVGVDAGAGGSLNLGAEKRGQAITIGNDTTTNGGTTLSMVDQYHNGAGWTAAAVPLSGSGADWTTYKANFGEVGLMNALNQAYAASAGGPTTFTGTVDAVAGISAGQLACLDDSNAAGILDLADAGTAGRQHCVGIVLTGAAQGATATIQQTGRIVVNTADGPAWTCGDPIFMAASVGNATASAPGVGNVQQQIGRATGIGREIVLQLDDAVLIS